nr:MAG TPA: hypothetical protein [Caudoviricetes sp.]
MVRSHQPYPAHLFLLPSFHPFLFLAVTCATAQGEIITTYLISAGRSSPADGHC